MEKKVTKKTKEVVSNKTTKPKAATVKKTKLTVDVLDLEGKVVGEMELPKEIFGVKPNASLVAQAIRVYLTNQRAGHASTKTRGDVAGGGKKPWKQKGTGRARIGSTRAPHWRGGGVIHGPHPRKFELNMPKKMKKAALISVLSSKAAANEVVVLNKIEFKEAKTKLAVKMFEDIGVEGKNIVVLPENQKTEERALKNIALVKTVTADEINTYDVLNFRKLLITKDAVEKIKVNLLGK